MTTDDRDRAQSSGAVAQAYDAGRPTFPAEALRWITGPGRLQVLDLAAGTGKLSQVALDQGHAVLAMDPCEEMLAICGKRRGIETMVGTAESIPLAHASVDVVLAGQSFHTFEHTRALPEIARVLRPNGVIGLLWNNYDVVVPWVRRLAGTLLGEEFGSDGSHNYDPTPALADSNLFSFIEQTSIRHWQSMDKFALRQLALSIPRVAALSEGKRAGVLEQVDAIYAGTARPPEPLRMPYMTSAFRARPSDLANYQRQRDAPIAPPL
ncbi:class I SAM-dependent methyltransferase [Kribbella deserti]|uniref:Class I SAM-dependent methyltransferase n=1 Tax=Kribbella deserti TaxID=1926257 RepID=A0ABV6QSS9_9ACTN